MLNYLGVSSDRKRFSTSIVTASFWSAIVLPVLYMPLLAVGINTRVEGLVFAALLLANFLALIVGHPYRSR